MIDELLLHIGMPKTGTTSIQRALNAARGGTDWTYLDLNPPHSANPVILRAYGGLAPRCAHPGPRAAQTSEAALAHITRAMDSVRTPRAVLSAEAIIRLPPAAVAHLLDHMSKYARSIRAVVYIRPPLSFLTSCVQQFYKTSYAPLDDVIRRAQRPISADVALWDHALGADRVQLYPFSRETFMGGSVVQHFAEALSLGQLPEQSTHANVSLSDEATRLMVQFRRRHPIRHPHDGRILHRLAALGGAPFRLHPAALTEALPLAQATHDWANERMGWLMSDIAPTADARALKCDADFDDILPETRDWLAAKSGLRASDLAARPEAVADAIQYLKTLPTQNGRVGRLAKRLRLA